MVLTGVDQFWIADITYIRLEEEFVYLAVILDAYSRRVIGWHLDDRTGRFLDAGRAAHGVGGRERCGRDWSIIPTAGCSTPAAITRAY